MSKKIDHHTYLQAIRQGALNLLKERAAEPDEGQPRAGSAGVLVGKKLAGTCHRIAMLRRMGLQEPPSFNSHLMWVNGEHNETIHIEYLTAANAGLTWMSDEAITLALQDVEQPLTGRPDNIICDTEGVPQLLIELKGIYGGSTAMKVFLEHEPKFDNVAQAAIYMRALNLPGCLSYTLPAWVSTGWKSKQYGGVRHVLPNVAVFGLEWRGDDLWIQAADYPWRKTCITWPGVQGWYQVVDEMKAQRRLGPRPYNLNIWGEEEKYSPCGLCPLVKICDRTEHDPDTWLQEVQSLFDSMELGRLEENKT